MRVMSGEDRGVGASVLRGALAVAEPFYAGAMDVRNWAYDRQLLKSHPLPRPTISVGNITTGGTGKTPVVRFLAEQFIARSMRPAILMRGYRGKETGGSDEERMLAGTLGPAATIVANPDRLLGATTAMASKPQPDVFLLDDAFQHRRVKRDFDLVLLDAVEPYGFGHVLPRGLMREKLHGMRRADAVIITRSDQATSQQLQMAQTKLRRWIPVGSVYFAKHAIGGLRSAALNASDAADVKLSELSQRRYFAFAGIANPAALQRQLASIAGQQAGFRSLPDHHAYSAAELASLERDAEFTGAQMLVTTEKDWVKIRPLAASIRLPIYRLDLRIEFQGDDETRLLRQIMHRVDKVRGEATTPATPGPWRG